MSSSRANQDMNGTHLKSTFQELKQSVVAGYRGDSFKSTAQPLKEKKMDSTVKKCADSSKGAGGAAK